MKTKAETQINTQPTAASEAAMGSSAPAVDETAVAQPAGGGSYRRNPDTGALEKVAGIQDAAERPDRRNGPIPA